MTKIAPESLKTDTLPEQEVQLTSPQAWQIYIDYPYNEWNIKSSSGTGNLIEPAGPNILDKHCVCTKYV